MWTRAMEYISLHFSSGAYFPKRNARTKYTLHLLIFTDKSQWWLQRSSGAATAAGVAAATAATLRLKLDSLRNGAHFSLSLQQQESCFMCVCVRERDRNRSKERVKESKKGIKRTKSKAYKHPKPISRQSIRSTNVAITKVHTHTVREGKRWTNKWRKREKKNSLCKNGSQSQQQKKTKVMVLQRRVYD